MKQSIEICEAVEICESHIGTFFMNFHGATDFVKVEITRDQMLQIIGNHGLGVCLYEHKYTQVLTVFPSQEPEKGFIWYDYE